MSGLIICRNYLDDWMADICETFTQSWIFRGILHIKTVIAKKILVKNINNNPIKMEKKMNTSPEKTNGQTVDIWKSVIVTYYLGKAKQNKEI